MQRDVLNMPIFIAIWSKWSISLYVSLAAIALGLVICGYLAFTKWSIS
jgi:hypothetical protein